MAILDIDDFIGEYTITEDCFNDSSPYIEKYEEQYLVDLLGGELYGLFISDLTPATPQAPQTARFINLFDPFIIDDGNCVYRSEGIRQMLVEFVYFHISRDNAIVKTTTGAAFMENENSTPAPLGAYNVVEAYNEGVQNALTIQWYIQDNSSVYPEENIQNFRYTSGI
jgi:hypothetical protein